MILQTHDAYRNLLNGHSVAESLHHMREKFSYMTFSDSQLDEISKTIGRWYENKKIRAANDSAWDLRIGVSL